MSASRDDGHEPAQGDADLAALAGVFAEPARAQMVLTLLDGRALPASVLAAEAGVAPSTASAHLARLVEAEVLRCRPQGRHRYYELAGPQVAELVEAMARLARPQAVRSLRQGTRAAALREARTCYDHLAGRLGVRMFGHLLDTGAAVGGDGRHDRDRAVHDRLSARGHDVAYRLTRSGIDRLGALCELPSAGPDGDVPLAYCVDWTEQRHHLGGQVGKRVTATMFERGWLARPARGRVVRLTAAGHDALVASGLLPDDEG